MAKEITEEEVRRWIKDNRGPSAIQSIVGFIIVLWLLFLIVGTMVIWTLWIWRGLFG